MTVKPRVYSKHVVFKGLRYGALYYCDLTGGQSWDEIASDGARIFLQSKGI